ncbi:PC4 and SFRS1-interacting protein-like isoform X2 [Patiria miniata]|nr:PC4 and SFRS1-interacting protein-like isoform X2 [Patiria miniata]
MNQFRLIVLLEVMAHTVFPTQASPIRVCGNELLDALMSVCGDRGLYSPPEGYSRRTPATQSGIATRCCISHCDTALLETYCNKPATPQSQTAAAPQRITSTSDDRRANEIVVDPPSGHTGDTAPRGESAKAPGPSGAANATKTPVAEVDEGMSVDEEEAAGESNTSERGVSLGEDEDQEEQAQRDIPTSRPHKTHSKERSKNRTKGEKKRRKTGRRRGISERRTLSIERKKDDATRRRRKEQRLLRKQQQSNSSKRRTKLEKKGSEVTTPVAIETAEHPFKNGGYNSTSGDLSPVNVTDPDSPPSSDTKKDGFFTTITAVLRDVIGFQQADDGNR